MEKKVEEEYLKVDDWKSTAKFSDCILPSVGECVVFKKNAVLDCAIFEKGVKLRVRDIEFFCDNKFCVIRKMVASVWSPDNTVINSSMVLKHFNLLRSECEIINDPNPLDDILWHPEPKDIFEAKADVVIGGYLVHQGQTIKISSTRSKWNCPSDSFIFTSPTFGVSGWTSVEDLGKASWKLVKKGTEDLSKEDKVNHPSHYTWLKELCGVEVIDITRHMDFNLGNAIKYILRSGHKSESGYSNKDKQIEDLKKAVWYIEDYIDNIVSK